ncbi:MAG: hypothetical protein KF708_01195 [Pirellulales bacterium]|nr:hypothetical protein [Pirellulales bacterium]
MRVVPPVVRSLVLCVVAVLLSAIPSATIRAEVPSEAPRPAPLGGTPGKYRKLAPGVTRTIPVERQENETFSRHDIPELLSVDPNFEWAKDVRFSHDIWNLEFTFKPIRFMRMDLPGPDGKLESKLVWYMVYRVRNVSDKPVDFIPYFVLQSRDGKKFYPDRVLPGVVPAIVRREDPNRPLADSATIAGPIAPNDEGEEDGVWGVVTWTDIDPRTDYFSVYVNGLTNAYRWDDTPQGRKFARKTLQLNFWRPGDEYDQHEKEIRVGAPGEVDYRWLYR